MILSENLTKVSQTVRPLRDRVLVQRLEYEHPVLATVGVTLHKGVVIATGYGRRQRKKVRFDLPSGHLSTANALYFEDGDETGRIRSMRVRVGDVVEFSPRNQIEWEYEGEKLVWIWEQAIYGTTDESKSNALLWQTVAGTDRHGNYLPGLDP
jgi:co-chaperonin GroES (HSP10)